MLSTLTTISLAASGGTLAAADSGVFASNRNGDHEGGFFLLLLLALIGGVIFFWRRRRGDANVDLTPPSVPPAPAGARALLDERFARGEIDQAEYEHRRAVLAGESATPPVSGPPAAPEAPADEPEADKNQ